MKLQFANPFTARPLSRSTQDANTSFKKWNRNLALVYVIQAAALLIVSSPHVVPITVSFLTKDTLASTTSGHTVLAPATQVIHNFNVGYLVAAFLLIAAVAHVCAAAWYRRRYERELKAGVNRLRWLEYALTGGLMLTVVAMVSGIYDIGNLFMIFALMMIASVSGLMLQVYYPIGKRTTPTRLGYIVAGLAFITPWLVVAGTLLATQLYGSDRLPGYVYGLYVSMLVLFAGVGLNLYLQYRKPGKWADPYYGEQVYFVLGMVAKTLLAWQVYAGVLHP